MTKAGETIAEVTTSAAQAAGETAAHVAEQVIASAEAATAGAVARAELAEELAENLTEAAFRSELGRRVTEIEDEVDQWQGEHESLSQRTAATETQISSLTTLATTMQNELTRLASLTAPPPLILPPSPDTANPSGETVIATTETVMPETLASSENTQSGATPVKKTKRFRLM